MKGYKYLTEQDVKSAIDQCDTYYGYPKQDCVTEHWCGYQHAELDGFWYIIYDQTIEVVLGIPEEFDITIQDNGL